MEKFKKIINRIRHFERHDWKHVLWLFGVGMKNFLLMRFDEADESFFWIKMHFVCGHTLVSDAKEATK